MSATLRAPPGKTGLPSGPRKIASQKKLMAGGVYASGIPNIPRDDLKVIRKVSSKGPTCSPSEHRLRHCFPSYLPGKCACIFKVDPTQACIQAILCCCK